MRPLQGELLLEAWDRGASQGALDRALTLLGVACPELSWAELADLPLPERELRLLRLRQTTFGDSLRGYVACPSCSARLEFEAPVSSMIGRLEMLGPLQGPAWRAGKWNVTMRPANSRDLAAAACQTDARASRRVLLKRCVMVQPAEGDTDEAGYSFSSIEERAAEEFNALHQGAEILLTLPCAACGRIEKMDLDIGRFLWSEVRHAALALFRDVRDLASAYGWSERSILAMSPARRSVYVEMAHR
jgi:hypothetical protein